MTKELIVKSLLADANACDNQGLPLTGGYYREAATLIEQQAEIIRGLVKKVNHPELVKLCGSNGFKSYVEIDKELTTLKSELEEITALCKALRDVVQEGKAHKAMEPPR